VTNPATTATTTEQDTTSPARVVESTALVQASANEPSGSISAFASSSNYEAAKRMAVALSRSTIVPKEYRGEDGLANCIVALELAGRTGASVMMVMQHMHVIQGRPSWSATFLIASVNACGRFTPIRYESTPGKVPTDPEYACRAVARDRASGDVLEGEWITWAMVKAEGWLAKAGSKWKTMPGQMFRYRAASFWTRTYAPEISLGMHTSDEVEDFEDRNSLSAGTRDLNAALRAAEGAAALARDVTPPAETSESIDEEIAREAQEALEEELRANRGHGK
jgi:hypothetical protein